MSLEKILFCLLSLATAGKEKKDFAFAHPLIDDFYKLSVEKEILEIGQDLTELEVNATLEILENLINIRNFAFE